MYNVKDTINLYKMAKKLAEMVGTNTDNLNLLATIVLELEKRLNDKK